MSLATETAAPVKTSTQKIGIPLVIVIGISCACAFTTFWWLALVAGILGGLVIDSSKKAGLCGFLGVICGWGLYMVIQMISGPMWAMLDIIGGIIVGSAGLAAVIALLVLLIGGVLGLLGGFIGNAIRDLTHK